MGATEREKWCVIIHTNLITLAIIGNKLVVENRV